MAQDEEIKAVVAEFDKLSRRRALTSDCGKRYCSTCGGLVGYVDKVLDIQTQARIGTITSAAKLGDYKKFGFWQEYIKQKYPDNYYNAYKISLDQLRNNLDLNDPRSIDAYLMRTRGVSNYKSPDLLFVIDRGIELALKTKDTSLLETLVLVLGEEALGKPEMLELAILKSKDYEPLKRALYNKLRRVRDDVRDFVGDGSF